MPQYFRNFPKVEYDIKKSGTKELMTNLTVRFKIQEILRSRIAVYHDYYINEGERADTIAFKAYEDPTLDWLIYLINVIIDPLFDWPLDYRSFINYIKEKYESVSEAQKQVHHYEWIYQKHKVLFNGKIIPEKTYEVDLNTYNTLNSLDRRVVYMYDYEEELNEQRRRIKLLDTQYVPDILNQIEGIFD